jgi:hypothetical protein
MTGRNKWNLERGSGKRVDEEKVAKKEMVRFVHNEQRQMERVLRRVLFEKTFFISFCSLTSFLAWGKKDRKKTRAAAE